MAHISFKPLLQRLKIKTKPVRTGPLTVSRRFSKPTLLALVAILALVGVVVVARSLAGGSLDTPRGANQLVLELTRGDEEVELKDGLKPYEPIPFRLYGNGLALCGQNKDTETNQPYLASTNLSQVQIADLVRQIQSTGFLKLQDEYSLTDAKAFQLQTAVRLNLSRGMKEVFYYDNGIPKPAAFTQTEAIIDRFCATVTTPYEPEAAQLRVTKVKDTKGQPVQPGWLSGESLPRAAADEADKVERRRHTAQQAKNLARQFKTKSTKVFQANGALYQAVIDPGLPPLVERKLAAKSRPGNVAYADGSNPVRFMLFCAVDACGGDVGALGGEAGEVRDWYSRQVRGKSFALEGTVVIRGRQTAGWYRTCRAPGGCPDALYAVWDNLALNRGGDNLVAAGKATVASLGFRSGDRGACGYGGVAGGGGIAVADVTNPSPDFSCSVNRYFVKTLAHELGHSFGLGHSPEPETGSVMHAPSVCGWSGGCNLGTDNGGRNQSNYLFDSSPYFNAGPSAIDQKHASLGGDAGVLGRPVGGEFNTYCRGARFRKYERGIIYWRSDVGAHWTRGDIYAKYGQLGHECGFLDLPVSDDAKTPNGKGYFMNFLGGSIHYSQATGAHWTRGAVKAKWAQFGYENGFFGFPTTDELPTRCGGGIVQNYQGATVYWRGDIGARQVHGAIRDKYGQTGFYECGFLGFPLTDQTATPNRKGFFNNFQGGTIHWSPETGAHWTRGAIKAKWGEKGHEGGFLGFPTTDESDTACAGGRFSNFQGGSVHWTPRTGAHSSNGPIRAKWAELGFECGFLGFPKSDVYSVSGATKQDFEGGSITRNNVSGAISVARTFAATLPNLGSYELVAKHSGKCVDVAFASLNDGANIQQFGCNGSNAQTFSLQTVPGNYYKYKLVAKHSGKCLDVTATSLADGANIQQFSCNGSSAQTFALQSVGAGYYQIVAKHSGKCLDVAGFSTADGGNIQQWFCRNGDNQRFLFRAKVQ